MKIFIIVYSLLAVTLADVEIASSNKYELWVLIKEMFSLEIFYNKSLFLSYIRDDLQEL